MISSGWQADVSSHIVLENVQKAQVKVKTVTDNVAGVQIPNYDKQLEGSEGTHRLSYMA